MAQRQSIFDEIIAGPDDAAPSAVQQVPGNDRVPPATGASIFDQISNTTGRSQSMTSPERYALDAKAREEVGLLEAAGVQGLSAMLKILDIINTPQQMLFGAAIGLVEGENMIASAIDGARNNVTGSDLLKSMDVGELGSVDLPVIGEVTGRGFLGLALDFGIDIPVFGAIGKAARVAKLPVIAKAAGRSIEKGGRALRAKGIPGTDQKGKELLDSLLGQFRVFQGPNERILLDAVQESKRIKAGKIGRAKKEAFELGEKVQRLAAKEGRTVNQVARELVDIIERKTGIQNKLGGISPDDLKFKPGISDEDLLKGGLNFKQAPVETQVKKLQSELFDDLKKDGVGNIRGKQEVFPAANDAAQVKTAKQILAKERDAAKAGARKQRGKVGETGVVSDVSTDQNLFDITIKSNHGDELFDLAMEAKSLMHDGVLTEINHGVATLALDDTWVDYLTHLLNPAAKKALLQHRGAGALEFTNASRLRVFNPNHSFQLLRKWDGMSITELNDLGKAGLLPGFEGVVIEELLTTDISTILAARLTRGIKATTDADIFTNAARQLGKHVDDVEDMTGFRKLAITANQDERLRPLGEYMNNFVFEKDVARHLDSYFATMQNPRGMHPFLEKFDKIQGLWKSSTLFMFPAYHSRNFVGNLWNNNLADATMWLPNKFGKVGYYSAASEWAPIRSSVTPLQNITLGGVRYTRQQMDDLMEKHGIKNQFREFLAIPEVAIGVKPLPGGEFLGRVPGVGRATERGIKIGTWMENHARTAHFFSALDNGKTAKEAAFSVKKYLFNYDELTDFEQASLRRIMPFFAWTRNNLPLQVRNIVSQPHKFSQLKDVIDFVEGEKTKPKGEDVLIQKWMKKNSPVLTRNDEGGNPEYFLLGGWLPAGDIEKIAKPWLGIGKIIQDEASPLLKEPIEQLFNFDSFLEREIEEFPGQKRKFAGVNLPVRMVGFLRNIRLLSLLDNIGASVEGAIREDQKTGIFSDATAKPIADMVLQQTLGLNIRSVDRSAAARGVVAQMNELKALLRRELRAGKVANAENVKDQLIDLTKRLQRTRR